MVREQRLVGLFVGSIAHYIHGGFGCAFHVLDVARKSRLEPRTFARPWRRQPHILYG
jgi:hypothetical protein